MPLWAGGIEENYELGWPLADGGSVLDGLKVFLRM